MRSKPKHWFFFCQICHTQKKFWKKTLKLVFSPKINILRCGYFKFREFIWEINVSNVIWTLDLIFMLHWPCFIFFSVDNAINEAFYYTSLTSNRVFTETAAIWLSCVCHKKIPKLFHFVISFALKMTVENFFFSKCLFIYLLCPSNALIKQYLPKLIL